MKYIKKFESNYNIGSIIQTIYDILLPISDIGYKIEVSTHDAKNWIKQDLLISIVRIGDKHLYIDNDVMDEFDRLHDFMKSRGYSLVVYYGNNKFRNMKHSYSDFKDEMSNGWNDQSVSTLFFVAKI
jgi:hypothetical protein